VEINNCRRNQFVNQGEILFGIHWTPFVPKTKAPATPKV